ncbi:MAG: hypothetical protein ACO3LE_02910 [Bdellovibrionota bacterium]
MILILYMKALGKVALVIGILCLGGVWLTWQMLGLAESECKLCIEFKGRTECPTAYGPNDEEAMNEAHRNACALLASGVTEVLACNRAARQNIECKTRSY